MHVSHDEVLVLLAALKDAGWEYAHIQIGDLSLTVSNNGDVAMGAPVSAPAAAPVSAPAPAVDSPLVTETLPVEPAAVAPAPVVDEGDLAPGDVIVSAPSIGTFWRSPQPGAPPFVQEGDEVEPSQTLCIVEVMKLMTQVVAPAAGRIVRIYPQNGQVVEYGQPLFLLSTGDGDQ